MTNSRNAAPGRGSNAKTSGGGGSTRTALPDSRLSKKTALDLPPPGVRRWGARSKAAVVTAVRSGKLSLGDARKRYALSVVEYLSWESAFDALGLEGLSLGGRQARRRALTYCEK